MKEKEELGCSRRTFVKGLSATAVALAGGVGRAAAKAPPFADVTSLSIADAALLLRNKRLSPIDLTQACLKRIERLNPKLNAFITVTAESALAQAREAE